MGSIAISLCQVRLSRVDGMATLWRTRAVDAAARSSSCARAAATCPSPAARTVRSPHRWTSSPTARSSRAHQRGLDELSRPRLADP
jgi:hypothetical protein